MLEFLRFAVVGMLGIVVLAAVQSIAFSRPSSEINHLASLGTERTITIFLGRARRPFTYRAEHKDDRLKNCQMVSMFATHSSIVSDDFLGGYHHGIVTFAGGQPIYSKGSSGGCGGGKLLGGFGVSGDGVDQDDAVAKATVLGAGFCLTP